MSTINFGSMLSYQFGGILIYLLGISENNFKNLWILIIIANVTTIIPLPILYFIKMDNSNIEKIENLNLKADEDEDNKVRKFIFIYFIIFLVFHRK